MYREKRRFLQWVRERFLLRFHMAFLLLTAFVVGLAVTKILVELHLDILWLRYLIAVTAAYAAFILLIKLWLIYLGYCARREQDRGTLDLHGDLAEAVCDIGSTWSTTEPVSEVGEQFGGGGASGEWAGPQPIHSSAVQSATSGGGGDAAGSGCLSLDFDEAIFVVLLAAAVLSVLLVGVWLIWAAPTILAEAAFEAALASALVRRARKMDSVGWFGSVVRATFWPFAVVLALSIAAGWYAQRRCPDATKIVHAIGCSETRSER